MDISSVAGNISALQFQSAKRAGSADNPVKGNPAEKSAPGAAQTDAALHANDKTSALSSQTDKQPTVVATPPNTSEPAGVASHVVISYNQQGKMRTKFEDSRNNVVYQIPSEMVAKMEDQMLKPETSTSVKG